ncbi:hypothetical protein BDN72DRAFT_900309 [Pluteus cervinus]|uniref:Uncharacterized protein n=1 Tax=Pluteus cervinus TaxID=181527 RepID=A0ACD3AJU9_9AGAR|nr:hypothetical protein BDN72DRAFT_900309 [Pluteus cervinus]
MDDFDPGLHPAPDTLPKVTATIFSYRYPYRTQEPEFQRERRLVGIAPFTFLDRHVNEDEALKRVVLLPSLTNDLVSHVDHRLAELRDQGMGPRPMTFYTTGEYGSPGDARVDYGRELTTGELLRIYTTTIFGACMTLASSWVIHPRAPKYYRTITSNTQRIPACAQRPGEAHDYLAYRFKPFDEVHPDVLSAVEDHVKGALRDLGGKELAAFIFLPLAPHTDQLVRDLDQLANLITIPSAGCTTRGYTTAPANRPVFDAEVTPWTLPVAGLESKITSDATAISSQDGVIHPRLPSATPLSKFEEMEDSTPEGLAHHAWRVAVCKDATLIVINCGNYERIGIRHRASQTLYISDVIDLTQSGYGKLHLGLQMAIIGDALNRHRLQHGTTPFRSTTSRSKRRRKADSPGEQPELRRSKRQKMNALWEEVRDLSPLNRKNTKTLWREVTLRPLLLVRVSGRGLNSSFPASFIRKGDALSLFSPAPPDSIPHEWKSAYQSSEYFVLILGPSCGWGATGHVYMAELQLTLSNGRKLSRQVVAKMPMSADEQKRVRHEYDVYRHLWTHNVSGIPEIYGLFEDFNNMATILVMERAAFTFRKRETEITGNDYLSEVTPAEKTACLEIVQSIHDAGVVHRDLRPENLMIAQDRKPMIIDFDHARFDATEAHRNLELERLRNVLDGKSLDTALFVE